MQWVVNWHFEEQIGNSYKNNSKVLDIDFNSIVIYGLILSISVNQTEEDNF